MSTLQRSLSVSKDPLTVFTKEDVCIHPANSSKSVIRGRLSLVKLGHNVSLNWQPFRKEDIDGIDKSSPGGTFNADAYAVKISVGEIQSIRRYLPAIGSTTIGHVIVCLKGGVAFPPFYFHNRGIRELISSLKEHIDLRRTVEDPNLFIVEEGWSGINFNLPSPTTLENQLEKAVRDVSHGILTGFSHVTRFARQTTALAAAAAQSMLADSPPSLPRAPSRTSPIPLLNKGNDPHSPSSVGADDDYLGSFEMVDKAFFPFTTPQRAPSSPLSPEEWCVFLSPDGRVTDEAAVRKRIFEGGVHEDLRSIVWKFLLAFYPWNSTFEERAAIDASKRSEYETLRRQWASISPPQEARFSKFRERRGRIEKDCVRTDRHSTFFAGEENDNVSTLHNILLSYCFYNWDLGYCQGMSDLAAPLLMVMRDEADAFWCFVGLMDNLELAAHFSKDQAGMHSELEKLRNIIILHDSQLYEYLVNANCGSLYFVFRWILIHFKREFEVEQLMRLWEMNWSRQIPDLILHISAGLLIYRRNEILGRKMQLDDLLKLVNDQAGKLDVDECVALAEVLYSRKELTPPEPEAKTTGDTPASTSTSRPSLMEAPPLITVNESSNNNNNTTTTTTTTTNTNNNNFSNEDRSDKENWKPSPMSSFSAPAPPTPTPTPPSSSAPPSSSKLRQIDTSIPISTTTPTSKPAEIASTTTNFMTNSMYENEKDLIELSLTP